MGYGYLLVFRMTESTKTNEELMNEILDLRKQNEELKASNDQFKTATDENTKEIEELKKLNMRLFMSQPVPNTPEAGKEPQHTETFEEFIDAMITEVSKDYIDKNKRQEVKL